MPNQPKTQGVLETCLYAEDLNRAVEFYLAVLNFQVLVRDDRLCAFETGRQRILILFQKNSTLQSVQLPGGVVPPHDGHGPAHLAFAIAAHDYDAWLAHLRQLNLGIESEMHWPLGGRSVYFRDPDQHLVELVTPGVWRTY